MYNLLKDFKHSRPGISTTISQFVRFSSSKLSKFERSDTLSKAGQSATFTSTKLEGSGGRDLSSLQLGNKSFLSLERSIKLDGRLKKLLWPRFKISNDYNFLKSSGIFPHSFQARAFSSFSEHKLEKEVGSTVELGTLFLGNSK